MINSMSNTSNITDKQQYDISHPKKYPHNDDYLLFPNTTVEQIKFLDCNDTIEGKCETNLTLDECLSKCIDNDNCGSGYFVRTPTSNICVPLNSGILPEGNITYKLRNQSIYPELDDSDITTFIDSTQFPFPPDEANTVLYLDVMELVDTKTNLSLGIFDSDPPIANFTQQSGTNIQIIPNDFSNKVSNRFVRVKYRDRMFFRVTGINYILSKKDLSETFEWQSSPILTGREYDTFQILKIDDPENKDILVYGDVFNIRYGDIANCAVSPNNMIITSNKSFEQLESSGYSTKFVFKPKMLAYYCENGKCKSVSLDKTETDGPRARYKNNQVFVHPGCYGLCNIDNIQDVIENSEWRKFSKSGTWWIWIAIFIPISIILLILLLLFTCR